MRCATMTPKHKSSFLQLQGKSCRHSRRIDRYSSPRRRIRSPSKSRDGAGERDWPTRSVGIDLGAVPALGVDCGRDSVALRVELEVDLPSRPGIPSASAIRRRRDRVSAGTVSASRRRAGLLVVDEGRIESNVSPRSWTASRPCGLLPSAGRLRQVSVRGRLLDCRFAVRCPGHPASEVDDGLRATDRSSTALRSGLRAMAIGPLSVEHGLREADRVASLAESDGDRVTTWATSRMIKRGSQQPPGAWTIVAAALILGWRRS